MTDSFNTLKPRIKSPPLRTPQLEGYLKVHDYFQQANPDSEVGIVIPVGCGKSGLISLIPFGLRSRRALVVAPYVKLAEQLYETFDPTHQRCFYTAFSILAGTTYPEPVEIRGTTTNRGDLDEADVVITNIDQLQGEANRWLQDLPDDYFDLILFDEGHHAVAQSWETLKAAFPESRIVNLSATPRRADGQLMPGRIIYSYPVRDAIAEGYVKRLKGLVLNTKTLRYVRREDGKEVEVPLEEVRRLGEEEADFRRSIVSARETLTTIIDASIRELQRIRLETGDSRHKIIASALNYQHCHQIVEAFRQRGLRTDFVHSREARRTNDHVLQQLNNHELDVIVQVRKLGEGFDHPYLSVAAVCSIFRELSPFVQFVGRIMRVIDKKNSASPLNQGTVVFHAGANVAQRWADFRDFSMADQEYFQQLLPLEGLDFTTGDEITVKPHLPRGLLEIREQTEVMIQEIPLLENPCAAAALQVLQQEGYTLDDILQAYEHRSVPTTKVRTRQAARSALDSRIRLLAGTILNERGISQEGHDFDIQRLGRTNFVVLKARIDTLIRKKVADKPRQDFTQTELNQALGLLDSMRAQVETEFFRAPT